MDNKYDHFAKHAIVTSNGYIRKDTTVRDNHVFANVIILALYAIGFSILAYVGYTFLLPIIERII